MAAQIYLKFDFPSSWSTSWCRCSWTSCFETGTCWRVTSVAATFLKYFGRAAPPALVALVGMVGCVFPWWVELAFERRGTDQGVALTVLTLAVSALVFSYLAAALTRYAARRWGDA